MSTSEVENGFRNDELLTKDDIATIVKNSLKKCVPYELINYQMKPYSSDEKLGSLGRYSGLTITVKHDDKVENLKYFVKSLPEGSSETTKFVQEKGIFMEEIRFYSVIVPQLQEYCKSEKWAPECFLIKENLLVMEDLKHQGYVIKKQALSLTEVKSVLATLARFHASSILAEARLQQPLDKIYPKAFKEKMFRRGDGLACRWIDAGVDAAVAIAEKLQIKNSNRLPSLMERAYDMIKKTHNYHRNVVCHGDLWTNNFLIMFDSSEEEHCVLLDFQLIRYASLISDVSTFLYVNTDREFRKESEMEVLRYYHTVLHDTIKSNNKFVNLPNFDEITRSYEEFRIFGKILVILYLPEIMMDRKILNGLGTDQEIFENLLVTDRNSFVLKLMETSEVFKRRMTEAIIELLEEK